MKKAMSALVMFTGVLVLLHGQSARTLRAHLTGTWRFVSSTQTLADGSARPDPQTGKKGVGYLIYSESGRMCVVVGNPDRPRWASVQRPTESELRSGYEGLVAYAGTFEVNEADQSVVHHLEVDRVPNLTGVERKRFCTFSGNRLTLRPAPPLPTGVKDWAIVWERVGN